MAEMRTRTKRVERNDVHRPGVIVPADYRYLFSYSYPGGGPGFNTALLEAVRTGETCREPIWGACEGRLVVTGYRPVTSPWGRLPFFHKTTGSETGCSICGAFYLHGDAWMHNPTGEVVLIGHMCADKMGRVPDRGEWTANQRALAALRKTAEYQRLRAETNAKRAAEGAAFLAAHDELAAALGADHYISRDLRAKLAQWGSLSPKQVALAFKLAAEAAAPKVPERAPVRPPTGRVTVEGVVVSTKVVNTGYGDSFKMLVRVDTPEGTYRVFGTVPVALDAGPGGLKGRRVVFTATIEPKEPGFGFFARPTGARVLEVAAA